MNVRSKAGGGIGPIEYNVDMRRTSIYMTHSVVKKTKQTNRNISSGWNSPLYDGQNILKQWDSSVS